MPVENVRHMMGQRVGERPEADGVRALGTAERRLGDLPFSAQEVFREFSAGSPVVFAEQVSGSAARHATVLQSAVQRSYQFARSVGTTSYRFRVMDPNGGLFRMLKLDPASQFFMMWTAP
jgi:hypothetical protein